MKRGFSALCILLFAVFPAANVAAQKVSVGYDKQADFGKFKTYSWAQPPAPPTRPFLYEIVVQAVDDELKMKGLTRIEGNGDLILIPAGGVEFGLNLAAGTPFIPTHSGQPPAINATMWTGAVGTANLTASYVPEGGLSLTFVEPLTGTIVWQGTVKEKLEMSNKGKALERVDKSIVKLLKQFPPHAK